MPEAMSATEMPQYIKLFFFKVIPPDEVLLGLSPMVLAKFLWAQPQLCLGFVWMRHHTNR